MKFNWTSDEATTLGITFTNNEKDTVLKNILPKLQNFKNCLKSWHHRKLTLIGKNKVLTTFALPKLIYVLTVLPNPPNDVINDIKSAIFNFIWDGKPDKIKRTQLIQSVENGGIQLTNIDSFLNAIKCSWVKRYLDNTNTTWSDVTHNLETQTSSKTILWNNKDITSNNKTFFYKDWFERSIKYVDQLYDYRIMDFYSFDNICYIYGIP
ncbi:hypothetical protein DPMN_175215 [Dreissena polymorpha]|uniref:Reverse transcriptase n=1 Tax=Dreissena polymorpha TaxID=45954 RepID=A0A9D4E4R8_DREPO|nr:hypothetical protein DPMN_175215 [Dreissena polymorpha]